MPAPTRPTDRPAWTQGNPGVQDQPTLSEKFGGFTPNTRPSPQQVNWILGNFSDWVDWLDYKTQIVSSQLEYDAVVGTNGTHATINAVMADANVANIYKVLVTTPQTLTATQVINKADIEFVFKPSAVYSKGGATTPGISIQADRVTLSGAGRFTDFSGVSDKAIQVEAGKKNNAVWNQRFNNCTVGVNDLGSNTSLANNIEEV